MYRRVVGTTIVLVCACVNLAAAVEPASQSAAVKGRVVFDGEQIPVQKPLLVNTCPANVPVLSEEWVVKKDNRGVRWVFVWLQDGQGNSLPLHPALKQPKQKEQVIDQPNCHFEPHALALREGEVLLAKNASPVAHNVHWTGFPIKNPGGNTLVPAGGSVTIKGLKADRLPVEVKCDIHPWMKAWVRVFDHPYFALTDANGNFEIKDVPAGNWRLVVWHETGYGPPYPETKGGAHPGRFGAPLAVTGKGEVDVGDIRLRMP